MQTRECRRCAAECPAHEDVCPLCGFVHVQRPIQATLWRVLLYGLLVLVGLLVCLAIVLVMAMYSKQQRSGEFSPTRRGQHAVVAAGEWDVVAAAPRARAALPGSRCR